MIVLQSTNFEISETSYAVSEEPRNFCQIELNSVSFGYATNTYWKFLISYNPEMGNWNFEKPNLPTYYETPRSILGESIQGRPPYGNPPKMRPGHTSSLMQELDPSFPNGFHRIAWDYPVSDIRKEYSYIHPDGERYLSEEEVILLHGSQPGEVPPRILEYLERHASFYETGAWNDQIFDARFDGQNANGL